MVDEEGHYSVAITTEDDCSNVFKIAVTEFCETALFAPNDFSPDGDGINDVWQVVATILMGRS